MTLVRQPDETFYFDELFANQAQLVAAYPNGNYQVKITGGGADKTVAITFAGGSVPPVRITNFDTLQAIANPSAIVTWEPVPAGGDDDELLFNVGRGDGTVITDTTLPGGTTSTEVYDLPAGETFIGNLAYARGKADASSIVLVEVYDAD